MHFFFIQLNSCQTHFLAWKSWLMHLRGNHEVSLMSFPFLLSPGSSQFLDLVPLGRMEVWITFCGFVEALSGLGRRRMMNQGGLVIWLKWRSRVSACQLCRWGSPKGITELLYRGIIGDWAWLDNNGFESSQQSGCFKYGSGENILKEILFDYSFPWPFKFSQQSLTASATPACSWLINVIWFGAHQIRARESYICSKQNYGWIKPLTCDEK